MAAVEEAMCGATGAEEASASEAGRLRHPAPFIDIGGKPPLLPGGGSANVAADDSTAAPESPSGEADLEGTLRSNTSVESGKEFSFGTTKPVQLPPAPELDLAAARPDCRPPPLAPVDSSSHSAPPPLAPAQTTSLPLTMAPESAAATKRPDRILSETDELEGGMAEAPKAVLSPKSDGEAGENMFTFGTTTALTLPDPETLRQMGISSAHDGPRPPGAEPRTGGTEKIHQKITPRWEPADHHQVPLPPVQEASPQPPVTPPDQAVALRSAITSPTRTRSLDLSCFSPPPLPQVQQMPQASQQYYHPQVAQSWYGQQVLSHPELPSQALPQEYYHEHMVPEVHGAMNAQLHGQLMKEHHEQVCTCGTEFAFDASFCRRCGAKRQETELEQVCTCGTEFDPDASFCRRCGTQRQQVLSDQAQLQAYENRLRSPGSANVEQGYQMSWEEQQLAYAQGGYGPYFGDEEEQEKHTLKAPAQPRGKRLAATGCIVFLAVACVGLFVLYVKGK